MFNHQCLNAGARFDKKVRMALICARFNESVVKNLRLGALDVFSQHPDSNQFDLEEISVPGVYEIPFVLMRLIEKNYDGIWVGGVVIQGKTEHDKHIVKHAYQAILKLQLKYKIPIGNSILHTKCLEDAAERSDIKQKTNQGIQVAKALLEMIFLARLLNSDDQSIFSRNMVNDVF